VGFLAPWADIIKSMQKESRLLRVGVVGAGPIAQFAHFDACRKARNIQLYSICDVAPDLLRRMDEIHRPQTTYTDYDELLADSQVEAVVIATSDAFHVPLARKALEAGKHVFVEKPLGLGIEECESLATTVKASQSVFQIGFNRRFDPSLSFAKNFIDTEMGAIWICNAWYCDSVSRYTMTDNLQPIPVHSTLKKTPAVEPKSNKRRYFLLTHGSHLLDTTRFLAGPIGEVRARYQVSAEAHTWSISLDFVNGGAGQLSLVIPSRGDFEEGVQVFGEHGSVQGRLNLPWYRKAGNLECFSARDSVYRRPLGPDADTYKLQLEAFGDRILKGSGERGASIEDGVANIRALVAIARSTESGRSIRLDEVSGEV
jgi:predicted dehydrogenase